MYFKTIFICFFTSLKLYTQVPNLINFQSIIKDEGRNLLVNQNIGIKVSLIRNIISNEFIYVEKQNKTTNSYGLLNVEIGGGTVLMGDFSQIDWSIGEFFLKLEFDYLGGENYSYENTTKLLSVPFALHSKTSDYLKPGGFNELDPVFSNSVAKNITNEDIDKWNLDNDTLNEIQFLSISNDTIFLTNGGYVKLPNNYDFNLVINKPFIPTKLSELINDTDFLTVNNDLDNDTLNEIQILSKTGSIISLSKNGGSISLNDDDPTNELQELALNENILSISNGNSVDLTEILYRNLNLIVSEFGDTVFISNNYVIIPGSSRLNNNSFIPPNIITTSVNNITENSVVISAEIITQGNMNPIIRGFVIGEMPYPTTYNIVKQDNNFTTIFYKNISNLKHSTTYYVRSFIHNEYGTFYGNQLSFETQTKQNLVFFNEGVDYGQINDIDGNFYKTVIIGDQEWMAENLKVTKFNNGIEIQNIQDPSDWNGDIFPKWSYYENNIHYREPFGVLYNWYVVGNLQNNVCPIGWKVPAKEDWEVLVNYLGGSNEAGGKLKEATFNNFKEPNSGATNSSGFTAIPGGFRRRNGEFSVLYYSCGFWTKSQLNSNESWYYFLKYNSNAIENNVYTKKRGYSIRCIKE
jgi:uncharacterized protein (TIGR02145 family)